MRELLRDFADRGGTVLLSSHLLLEVEAVADQLLIIGNGRIVAEGSREELLAGAGMLVRATDADALVAALPTPASTPAVEDGAFIVDAEPEAVGRAALDGRVVLTHLGPSEGAGLEQLFFDLTETPHEPLVPPPDRVELRKMVDTRAGFWLQLIVAALTLAVVVVVCIVADDRGSPSATSSRSRSRPPASCCRSSASCSSSSEWSQRTALITFTLVPSACG